MALLRLASACVLSAVSHQNEKKMQLQTRITTGERLFDRKECQKKPSLRKRGVFCKNA